jgi:SAM-dependent methyltransferase
MRTEHTNSSFSMLPGIPRRSDLNDGTLLTILGQLRRDQKEFLQLQDRFRSPEYRWPRDALHNWSRVWEYPYAYERLTSAIVECGGCPKVLDFGSGVTFFPFSVARQGAELYCADIDPICERDLGAAAQVVISAPGSVHAVLLSGEGLPFGDKTFDVAYCISVLEHIPEPGQVIAEIARCLKPDAQFILTIDIDLKGNAAIGPEGYYDLLGELDRFFYSTEQRRTCHPRDLLTSESSPYPLTPRSGAFKVKSLLKDVARAAIGKKILGLPPVLLTVEGMALRRR